MKKASRLHRFSAWLACLGMVFAVLAPSVVKAGFLANSPADSGSGWAEVCTAAGMKLVQLEGADGPQETSGSLMYGEHCPFCHIHADIYGPLPQSSAMTHPATLRLAMPRLFLQAPRTLAIWVPAQSRAPPSCT